MTQPLGDPLKIGDRTVRLGFWGQRRQQGDPRTTVGTFTLVDGEGDVVLDVFEGPKGDPGVNAPIFDWQYDSTITNVGDLPDVATLGPADTGRGWLIGTTWYVYQDAAGVDGEYKEVDAGIPGPRGLTPNLDITAELRVTTDPNDLDIPVVPYGDSLNPGFKLRLPTRALRGPAGPSTNIRLAPDYDNSTPPLDGQGMVWDEGLDKFRPGDLSPTSVLMRTIPHVDFQEYSGSAGRQLIASLDLDPLTYAWYPDVAGRVKVLRNFLSSVQVEIEVRIGPTGVGTGETADLCGLGPYDPQWALLDATAIAYIDAQFSDTANPGRAVAPDAAAGRVPAGQAMTLYVFTHKIGGSGTYTIPADYVNQIKLLQYPVS